MESQKAKEEEEKKKEEEYQKRLAEQKKREEEYKERCKIEEAQKEEIKNHVKIVDIEESEKYIVSGSMICGYGKECDIAELQEEGTEKEESAVIKKELYFIDERVYGNFCNMFLHDFDFLSGCGGTGTLDKRVTDDNYMKLNSTQRNDVKWILWDCVAVFLNGELKLIIDPEGYSYSRYVNIVSVEYEKTALHEEEQKEEQAEREAFYIPAPIEKQAQEIEVQKDYKLIYVDSLTMYATVRHITISKKDIKKYGQYKNSLYIEFTEKGKKKVQAQYLHDGNSILLYSGFLPPVPEEITQKKINNDMYEICNTGINVNNFMVDTFKYYKKIGYEPKINTLQF